MQNGSLMKSTRQNGQTVWEFGWRDRTSGKAVYRRIVLGTTQQFATEREARDAVVGIVVEINVNDPRLQTARLTISQLAEHYQHRELASDNTWKTYSTKMGNENYLKRWIDPKWGTFTLSKIKPIEVESWLRPTSFGSRFLREDQEHHERPVQPCVQIRTLFRESDPPCSPKRQTSQSASHSAR